MFKKDKDEIDAGSEIDAAEAEREELDEDRNPDELGGRRRVRRGGKAFLMLTIPLVAIVAMVVTYKAMNHQSTSSRGDETLRDSIRHAIPEMTSPPPEPASPPAREPEPAPEPVTLEDIEPPPQQSSNQGYQSVAEARGAGNGSDVRERRLSSSLIVGGASGGSGGASAQQASHDVDASGAGLLGGSGSGSGRGGNGELAERLQPTRLDGARASVLENRDMLLTQGTMLDCALDTRIVSTQPGMLTCHTTRDVYSTSGRVVLIERGSKIVGEYQGGIQQGQGRIFALWTRVETPQGVVINLDSPGTGPLGEGGHDGHIDTHFGARFGGAILISLIGDVGNWLSNQGSGSNNIQFNQTADGAQQAAVEALRNSVNIPPTLTKNQGERIGVYVARDLDFSGVYELRRR